MSYDTELAALLSEPWNESVCRGYTILALERCGYKTAVIQRVMSELHELLDFTSPQEAQAYPSLASIRQKPGLCLTHMPGFSTD